MLEVGALEGVVAQRKRRGATRARRAPRAAGASRFSTRSIAASPIARKVVSLPPATEISPDADSLISDSRDTSDGGVSASPLATSGRTPAQTERMSLVVRPACGKASFAAASR